MYLKKIYSITFFLRLIKRIIYTQWNKFIFKITGCQIGSNFQVYNKFYLEKCPNSIIKIGNNFLFTSGDSFNPLCRNITGSIFIKTNASIIIGNNVGISSACLWANKSIIIGDNVKIGGDTIIMDTDAHSINYYDRRDIRIDKENTTDKEIIIGDDVLIGTRCIILKGIKIGARSVIGSGSIVTKDIPCDCIAAGNPCKVIKFINHGTSN